MPRTSKRKRVKQRGWISLYDEAGTIQYDFPYPIDRSDFLASRSPRSRSLGLGGPWDQESRERRRSMPYTREVQSTRRKFHQISLHGTLPAKFFNNSRAQPALQCSRIRAGRTKRRAAWFLDVFFGDLYIYIYIFADWPRELSRY